MFRLLLASASPARLTTLRAAGVEPSVRVSTVDEDAALARVTAQVGALDPADAVLVLARAKAEDVARSVGDDGGHDDDEPDDDEPDIAGAQAAPDFVLGCDSMLEFGGEVRGKPADADDARRAWRSMRGRTGVLHTGHWLIDLRDPGAPAGGTGATLGATSSTRVHFADLSDAEIDAYVATGEPLRVAGAFTIDGLGGPFVDRIEGDHHGVVGLSLPVLRALLADLGVAWHQMRGAIER